MKAKIPSNVKLCGARHTFATDLLDQTGNIALVGEVLGHEDLRTRKKYLHPQTSNLASLINERNSGRGIHLVATA